MNEQEVYVVDSLHIGPSIYQILHDSVVSAIGCPRQSSPPILIPYNDTS